jgi:hypothetical protein
MGLIRKPHSVKLIIGFIFKDEAVLSLIQKILTRHFGQIDHESRILPFTQTDYYQKELGKDLKRKFISFKKLILPSGIAKIKNMANRLEERFLLDGKRRINIDPGYLDMAKLVLASTKDYMHRIYLDRGIYAEVTLYYQKNSFKSWEWTYRDYATAEYISIFNTIRELYAGQINRTCTHHI